MNKKILLKVKEELAKDQLNKDLVVALVDILLDMDIPTYETPTTLQRYPPVRTESISDEEIIPDYLRPGPLGGLNN